MENERAAVRKRAITAFAHLLTCCELELFDNTINLLVDKLNENKNNLTLVQTYIQALAAISRLCGQRFGSHLGNIVPLIVNLCSQQDDELKGNFN